MQETIFLIEKIKYRKCPALVWGVCGCVGLCLCVCGCVCGCACVCDYFTLTSRLINTYIHSFEFYKNILLNKIVYCIKLVALLPLIILHFTFAPIYILIAFDAFTKFSFQIQILFKASIVQKI